MKCEKCGCYLNNLDTVCSTCGAEVSVSSQDKMYLSKQSFLLLIRDKIQAIPVIKSNKSVIIAILIGAAIGLIISLVGVMIGWIIGAAIGYSLCQKKVIDFLNKLIFEKNE